MSRTTLLITTLIALNITVWCVIAVLIITSEQLGPIGAATNGTALIASSSTTR